MALAHHGSGDQWWQRWPEATSVSAGSRSGCPRPADASMEPMKVVPSSLPGFMDPVKVTPSPSLRMRKSRGSGSRVSAAEAGCGGRRPVPTAVPAAA
eukprot:638536-Lingulodinium_polyedra.AAC.1